MTRRGWISVAVLVVVVLGVAGAIAVARSPGQGPLGPKTDDISFESIRREIGGRATMPVADLGHYQGDEPAVLDSVTPNEVLVGMRVLGYGVTTGVGALDGFPPKGHPVQPVSGFRITSATGPIQVVVGLELTHSGDHHVNGFTLRYHVGSTHYTAVFHEGVTFCSTGSSGC